jgi:hypothetical protein
MKDTQYEQLFTELTSAEAEIIEGGVLVFSSNVNFDSSLLSRTFTVPNGHDVWLGANVSGGDDGQYSAQLIRVDTQPDQNRAKRTLRVGSANTQWRDQPGGTYRIAFSDRADGRFIRGSISVHTGNFT